MHKYHPEHTWVMMEDGKARIGLTFYAQAKLGEIVYIDLPEPGSLLRQGEVMSGIESAKTTSEVIAPLSGEVVESNQDLEGRPDLINESPLELGWVTRIKPSDLDELKELLDLKGYEAILAEPVE